MFFKRYDTVSEDQIVVIGITAATMCHIVESRFPPNSVEAHINYVNDSIDNVLKNLNINPKPEILKVIRMATSTLVSSPERMITKRVQRFLSGDKRVNPEEIDTALNILQNSVNEYLQQR